MDSREINSIFGFYCLFRTMTNKCTIISQIITLLHVSTVSCHPQGACNYLNCQVKQVFQMQLLVIQFITKMFHIGFMQQLHLRYVCNFARYRLQVP